MRRFSSSPAGSRHLTLVPPPGTVADVADVVTIRLQGEYDVSAERDLGILLSSAENSAVAIIDCTDVTFLDSSALECLLRLRNRMTVAGGGGEIRVAGANEALARLFSVTGLDRVFKMYPTVERAITAPA